MAQHYYMQDLIIDFIEYMEVERGRSSKTAENYKHYLERFVEFAGAELTVDQITPELVRRYRCLLYTSPSPRDS